MRPRTSNLPSLPYAHFGTLAENQAQPRRIEAPIMVSQGTGQKVIGLREQPDSRTANAHEPQLCAAAGHEW